MWQVALPLCSEAVAAQAPYPQTLLLYGPSQGGKSMLIDALAAECGANVFELGHRNTDGKYEKKKAAIMMHMVFKVAKAFAPSIGESVPITSWMSGSFKPCASRIARRPFMSTS